VGYFIDLNEELLFLLRSFLTAKHAKKKKRQERKEKDDD